MNSNFEIFITSYKRSDPRLQYTWKHLPEKLRKKTKIVVQAGDAKNYQKHDYPLLILPKEIKSLPPTRQFLLTEATSKKHVFLLEDDLSGLDKRCLDNSSGYKAISLKDSDHDEKMMEMFEHLLQVSQKFAHCGPLIRLGANKWKHDDILTNHRLIRFVVYNVKLFDPKKFDFCAIGSRHVMDDFDYALQLITSGFPNGVTCEYCQDHKGSQTEGGWSVKRTPSLQEICAKRLEARWPGLVKVVEKKTASTWNTEGFDGTRKDVRISWKKAGQAKPGEYPARGAYK